MLLNSSIPSVEAPTLAKALALVTVPSTEEEASNSSIATDKIANLEKEEEAIDLDAIDLN